VAATCSSCSPTSPPANDHWMELLVMADALRRASAGASPRHSVFRLRAPGPAPARDPVAITPSWSQHDAGAGVSRVLTIDLHADQSRGSSTPGRQRVRLAGLLGDAWKQKYPDMIVVSPDVGGVSARARPGKRSTMPILRSSTNAGHGPTSPR